MDLDRYLDLARRRIRDEGVHLQGVHAERPHDVVYGYSVGFSERGLPELLCFSCCLPCVDRLLGWARDRVSQGHVFEAGREETLPSGDALRIGAVHPGWGATFAKLVPSVLERDPGDVSYLQIITPDHGGRWPEDPLVDPLLLDDQPLLDRDLPWLRPILHDELQDLWWQPARPAEVEVAVPVVTGSTFEGRFELLRAEPVDDTSVRIVDVPWCADHISHGARVETRDAAHVPGLPQGTRQLGAVLADGWATRTYWLGGPDIADAVTPEHHGAIERGGPHRLSTTAATLHANVADPDAWDTAVRPLVRDGILRPTSRYCDVEPDHRLGDCPSCGWH
jgi:hypothetical protein